MTDPEIKKYLKMNDFYEILGINKDATDNDIKKAYRKMALKFHPDKNKFVGTKDVFKKISQAYDCLINPEKKAFYDKHG
jgi:DnaJ-class molecular chaperone